MTNVKKRSCTWAYNTKLAGLAFFSLIKVADDILSLFFSKNKHYQKIDKYKRKYRGNIFIGKFSRDFTDGNIPSVYTDEITMEKKFKQSKKKKMTCHFYQQNYRRNFSSVNSLDNYVGKLWILFIMSITKGITDGIFRRYFPESVIWRFSEKIQLI